MSAAKAAPVDLTEVMQTIQETLQSMQSQLELHTEMLCTTDTPQRLRDLGAHVRVRSIDAAAKRARVGLAAKRNGMTLEQWIATHGEIDTNPA